MNPSCLDSRLGVMAPMATSKNRASGLFFKLVLSTSPVLLTRGLGLLSWLSLNMNGEHVCRMGRGRGFSDAQGLLPVGLYFVRYLTK